MISIVSILLLLFNSYFIHSEDKYFINDLYIKVFNKYEKLIQSGVNNTYFEVNSESYSWLIEDAVKIFIQIFHHREKYRLVLPDPVLNIVPPRDRRSASPFPTDDAFRVHCYPNICYEDKNGEWSTGDNCYLNHTTLYDGACVYVKASMLPIFVNREMPNLKVPITLVTDRYNDQSVPDSQTLRGLALPRWSFKDILQKYHDKGLLISMHGVNTWWMDYRNPKPSYLHCIPIGLETRDCYFGAQLEYYITNMKRIHFRKSDSNSDAVVTQRQRSLRQRNEPRQMRKAVAVQNPPLRVTEAWSGTKGNNKSLLLVALDAPLQNKPDRAAALNAMRRNGFAVHKKLDHHEWLDAIAHHKFTLAPFGHGLDTHRLTEILLFGGVPVIRRSTISSCYDDSDNVMLARAGARTLLRGSIPLVVVNSWSEVTRERLDNEWRRIAAVPPHRWDWRRLFADHWLERLDAGQPKTTDSEIFHHINFTTKMLELIGP